jgi:hypothetical protein
LSIEPIFFGPGNSITWDSIVNQTLPKPVLESLQPFLDSLRNSSDVAILPRLSDAQFVIWYVLCRTPRSARFALDELRGFLGPSLSLSEGTASSFDPSDPIDAIVRSEYSFNAFKLVVPSEVREAARGRLLDYLALRAERPNRVALLVRTAGRIIRDFEYALLAGDFIGASERIAELRNAGHLSATNLLFLEIRALGAANRWESVYNHPQLDALLAIQRPIRVTEALIKAVYNTQLQAFESDFRTEEAVRKFAAVYGRFSMLYKTKVRMAGTEIDASFILAAIITAPSRNDIADEILAHNLQVQSANLQYLQSLHSLLRKPDATVTLDITTARAAFSEGNIDQAYCISLSLPASFDRTAILLRCAREMETLEASNNALQSIADLSAPDQARLQVNLFLSKIIDRLGELRSPVIVASVGEPTAPRNWLSWLERLSGSQEWAGAVNVAEVGADEWSLEALANDEEMVRRTADLILADRPPWAVTSFRDSLPYLVHFFTSSGADPKLRSVYESLFLVVSVDDQISGAQAIAISRLASVRLELGLSATDYADLIEQLSGSFSALDSPTIIDSLLDACEILISFPCPVESARIGFFSIVSSSLKRWYRRVDQAQISLFEALCQELGVSLSWEEEIEQPSGEEEGSLWKSLLGKKLALYSLKEAAVKRAADLLEELVGEVRVDVFLDHVGGSPALKTAAQQADVFVISTAAAKHSATMFIESKRPKDAVTLYAQGQGTSSILRAISSYLAVGNSK